MNPFAPYSSKQEARAPLSDRELNNGAPLNDMESESMPITGVNSMSERQTAFIP